MMFYFMMCAWSDGEKPKQYTHEVFAKTYSKNLVYSNYMYIASCLDY